MRTVIKGFGLNALERVTNYLFVVSLFFTSVPLGRIYPIHYAFKVCVRWLTSPFHSEEPACCEALANGGAHMNLFSDEMVVGRSSSVLNDLG